MRAPRASIHQRGPDYERKKKSPKPSWLAVVTKSVNLQRHAETQPAIGLMEGKLTNNKWDNNEVFIGNVVAAPTAQ